MDKSVHPSASGAQRVNRVSGPTHNHVQHNGIEPDATYQQPSMHYKKRRKILLPIITIIVVILLAAGSYYLFAVRNNPAIKTNEYQVVFLTNGQVYFGKLKQTLNGTTSLTDIFYLQNQQSDTAATSTATTVTPQSSSTIPSNTQLVKLGQELHAPEDKMTITKDQILFWENIQNSGKVAQAINSYKPKS